MRLGELAGETTRYTAGATLALAADFSVYVALIRLGGVHYLLAAPVGFAVGLALIYGLSVRWVFRHRRLSDARLEFALFAAIGFGGMALNELVIYAAVEAAGFSYEFAKLAAAAIVFGFNFGLRKSLLFTRR